MDESEKKKSNDNTTKDHNVPSNSSEFTSTTNGTVCVVCSTRPRQLALIPCGHFNVCVPCGYGLEVCPNCGAAIDGLFRIFDWVQWSIDGASVLCFYWFLFLPLSNANKIVMIISISPSVSALIKSREHGSLVILSQINCIRNYGWAFLGDEPLTNLIRCNSFPLLLWIDDNTLDT